MYVFTVYLLCVCVCWPLSSPDGSYTEEQNSETQVKANINPTSTTPEFDDEFDDEEVLPTIGTCKALYPFEGNFNDKWTSKQPESKTNSTISAYFKYLESTCWSNASGKILFNLEPGTWLLWMQCEELWFNYMRKSSCVTFVRKCLEEEGE